MMAQHISKIRFIMYEELSNNLISQLTKLRETMDRKFGKGNEAILDTTERNYWNAIDDKDKKTNPNATSAADL